MAVLALLMAVLAPSISLALADPGDSRWDDFCSTSDAGAPWQDAHAGQRPALPDGGPPFHQGHDCSMHACAAAMPAAPVVLAAAVTGRDLAPVAFAEIPPAPQRWVTARPRAPPRLS